MSNIKTAISLDKGLFEQLETIAHKMKIPRSRLYALALEDFVRRHENAQLLQQINTAYEEGLTPEEKVSLQKMRRKQRRIVEGEW